MIPHALLKGDITQRHLDFLQVVRALLDDMPGTPSCHEVCEFLAYRFPDKVSHWKGKFNGSDHSWLVFRDHDPGRVILDPYPWCSASGPLLVTVDYYLNPWAELYDGGPVG